MVGGHRVAKQRQNAGADDILHRLGFGLHTLKIGRMLNIGRFGGPAVHFAVRYLDRLPGGVAIEYRRVLLAEHGGLDLGHCLGDLGLGWPQVRQVDVLAVTVDPQWLIFDIDAHIAGEGIGDHQRRRGQPVGLDQRVYPALEIAVA